MHSHPAHRKLLAGMHTQRPIASHTPVSAAGVARAAVHGWAERSLVLPTDLQGRCATPVVQAHVGMGPRSTAQRSTAWSISPARLTAPNTVPCAAICPTALPQARPGPRKWAVIPSVGTPAWPTRSPYPPDPDSTQASRHDCCGPALPPALPPVSCACAFPGPPNHQLVPTPAALPSCPHAFSGSAHHAKRPVLC